MLSLLQIDNYALIAHVALEFGPGFNVLTGETGSGKSIIVDALGLLLGERADAAIVRSGAAAATVTGIFEAPLQAAEASAWCEAHGLPGWEEESVTLRREVASGGRSRAFVENQPVALALLRELAARLAEIHSQHESLVSFTPAAQLALLDRYAESAGELAAVAAAFAAWRSAGERLEALRRGASGQDAELWRQQLQEIDVAQLKPGEDAALEQERVVLANAERILGAAQAAYAALYDAPEAAITQLKAAQRSLADWQRFDPAIASLSSRVAALGAEAADVAHDVRSRADRVEAAPGRLAQIEDRLALLDRLRRKFGPTLEDVLLHRQEIALRLDQVENAAALQAAEQANVAAAEAAYRSAAEALSRRRRAAAPRLAKALVAEVAELAMNLRFELEFGGGQTPAEWTSSGWDRIRFMASTNPGEPLQPLAEIASGGELSRLLLALHLVAGEKSDAGQSGARRRTMVLDEVDAGIGGRAAEAVGRKLQQLGRSYQVLCVTHLPQIAAFASHHLRVEKAASGGRTQTRVEVLPAEQRVEELARMLAGNQVSATSLQHARELLKTHQAAGARGR